MKTMVIDQLLQETEAFRIVPTKYQHATNKTNGLQCVIAILPDMGIKLIFPLNRGGETDQLGKGLLQAIELKRGMDEDSFIMLEWDNDEFEIAVLKEK